MPDRIRGTAADQPLGGTWELVATAPGCASNPGELDALDPEWIACDGPMTVAAALRAKGLWDLDQPRNFDADDWWYRCRFDVADSSQPVTLHFQGLATVADVWLNGRHLLHSENMFVPQVVPVPEGMESRNELVLRFHALAPLLARKRPRPRWRSRLVPDQGLRWFRTSLLGRIQGWCPAVAPVGPWRSIRVETTAPVLHAIDLQVELDGADGLVTLRGRVRAVDAVAGLLTVGGISTPLTCGPLDEGELPITAQVRMPGVECWWPHTHGRPVLYPVSVALTIGNHTTIVDLGRIGCRSLVVDRGVDGSGFGLVVNGTPIFCRGVCWTPLDLVSLSATAADYQTALEQLRDAGMNMVRIVGGMTDESETFHDVCDALGILVWQDLMFASLDYPGDDQPFNATVMLEAASLVGRLRHRPSLAVICGSSEVEQQAALLGLPAERRRSRLFDELLPGVVHSLAPRTAWVPSTPSGGAFAFVADAGVCHYYGVGAYLRPFEDARRAGVRFASECLAFSNVPEAATIDRVLATGEMPGSHPRWKAGVPRDPGAGWDFEDVRDHYLERLFGTSAADLRRHDPERYLALGRIATAEAMLRTFAEWRRPGSSCHGGLVWFARDLQPGAGWGIVDATGRAKAAYWYLRRALAPVALLAADEGLNGLWLHAVNDTPDPIAADLRVALYRGGSRYGSAAATSLIIPQHGHQSIHAEALFSGFVDLTSAYRLGPQAHDLVWATLRDHVTGALQASVCYFPGVLPATPGQDLGLTATVESIDDGSVLRLETARFALAVAIEIDGWLPADNYLHLEPGEIRRVALRRIAGVDCDGWRGSVQALNAHGPVPLTDANPAIGAAPAGSAITAGASHGK